MSEEMDTGTVEAVQTDDAALIPSNTPEAETPEVAPEAVDIGWMFAAGVKGEGDSPDWFKSDKYKTVSDQAEAYTALESRFGSFTGAPENYEYAVSEELAEKGVEFDSEDPLMQEAVKFAKESNMNQEGFDRMINLYAMSQVANQEALGQSREDEMKALGDNAQSRVENIAKWGSANLSEEQFNGLKSMATTAEAVKAIEALINKSMKSPIDPSSATPASAVTEAEVKEMQFAKDEYGNRKIHTDKAFAAEYKKKLNTVYGSADYNQVIG